MIFHGSKELFDAAFDRLQEIFNLETLEDMQQESLMTINGHDVFVIQPTGWIFHSHQGNTSRKVRAKPGS